MRPQHPRSGRGRWLFTILATCALVLATATTALPQSRAAAAPARQDCISTPAQYKAAWDARQVRCVSPSLYVTAFSRGDSSLYPAGFWFAWANSSGNLESYLKLRNLYGDRPDKVGVGILSFVGFPGLDTWNYPMDLQVYTLPAGVRAQVPTFATWQQVLAAQYGTAAFPAAAEQQLARSYAGIGPNQDVVGAFQAVTGCDRTALLQGSEPTAAIGCNRDFLDALTAAGPSPYSTGRSKTCFQNFATGYKGPRNAAALRAVLYRCQDAGFLNTGAGVGYNTYANPFVCAPADRQTVQQRYTGREFILPNTTFDALPSHVDIPLDLGTPGNRDFLQAGYC